MSDLAINSSSGTYPVHVGPGTAVAAIGGANLILLDPSVAPGALPSGVPVIELIGDESTKTLAGCEQVLVAMRSAGLRRGDTVVAIGGGVVQDVATLVSSLYMRGVDWIYVPTTVMSMVDSCIGGKSSINAGGIKNLVGNVYPPKTVAVDTRFVETLPEIAVAAGLCEAVKICFCRGGSSFTRYLELADDAGSLTDASATAALFAHTLTAKKWFIEVDEFDKAERQQLNFGHSFGHAYEAASGFALPHGIAVGIGMVAASLHPGSSAGPADSLIEYVVRLLHPFGDQIRASEQNADWARFRLALSSDKKNSRELLRLVLPSSVDPTAIIERPLNEEELATCEDCVKRAIEKIAG